MPPHFSFSSDFPAGSEAASAERRHPLLGAEPLRRALGRVRGSDGPALWALVPAAGSGSRAGPGGPKQYRPWRDRPVLAHSLETLSELRHWPSYAATLVVVAADDQGWESPAMQAALGSSQSQSGSAVRRLVAAPIGGGTRRESVLAGLRAISEAAGEAGQADWVLVHDAARPGLSEAGLARLVQACLESGRGGLLALPVADTLKQMSLTDDGPVVGQTIPRDGLWAAQTPQMFPLGQLLAALESAPNATDESSAMEAAGYSPLLVLGDPANAKLTFPHDFEGSPDDPSVPPVGSETERCLPMTDSSAATTLPTLQGLPRIGQGFDVHALVAGRPLIIGGVHLPYDRGLLGHSDADVLLHAISDALLGAACLGDIGQHFPDTDGQYKNADSRVLLRHVVSLLYGLGLRVLQIDATIIAQAPKMAPHLAAMRAHIEADTGCSRINLKATTTERLGFTGRGEGIAAQAVALVIDADRLPPWPGPL